MNILFLDDDPTRVADFTRNTNKDVVIVHVKSIHEFNLCLGSVIRWDWIFLDHDLGVEESPNGQDAARIIADNPWLVDDDQRIVIHSGNSYGVAKMMDILKHRDSCRVDVIWNAWDRARYSEEYGLFFVQM